MNRIFLSSFSLGDFSYTFVYRDNFFGLPAVSSSLLFISGGIEWKNNKLSASFSDKRQFNIFGNIQDLLLRQSLPRDSSSYLPSELDLSRLVGDGFQQIPTASRKSGDLRYSPATSSHFRTYRAFRRHHYSKFQSESVSSLRGEFLARNRLRHTFRQCLQFYFPSTFNNFLTKIQGDIFQISCYLSG